MKSCRKVFVALFALAVVLCLASTTTAYAKKSTNSKNNLLKNGSFEKWKEKDGYKVPSVWKEGNPKEPLWGCVENSTEGMTNDDRTGGKDIFDGKYIIWPTRHYCETALLYQTVDISKVANGKTLKLSALLCNYPQEPNDEAVLKITLYDKKGKAILSKSASQRNPKWVRQVITVIKPKTAVKAKVSLIANRFVGSDNDAYFDDVRLEVSGKAKEFYIYGNKNTAAGGTDQLTVYEGTSTDAADYIWSSSYENFATVDESGLVTFTESYDAEIGVTIYATSKKTKAVAIFNYGKKAKNDYKP